MSLLAKQGSMSRLLNGEGSEGGGRLRKILLCSFVRVVPGKKYVQAALKKYNEPLSKESPIFAHLL